MEDGLPGFESTDMTEDVAQQAAGFEAVLSHTVTVVGIGAYGDDFSAQFLKPAEDIGGGQEAAAAVHAAGVQLQTFAADGQLTQDLVDEIFVLLIGNRTGRRITRENRTIMLWTTFGISVAR